MNDNSSRRVVTTFTNLWLSKYKYNQVQQNTTNSEQKGMAPYVINIVTVIDACKILWLKIVKKYQFKKLENIKYNFNSNN